MWTNRISTESVKKITSTNYQKDTLYPAVSRAIGEILQDGEVVTPVDFLLRLQRSLFSIDGKP